MQKITLTKYAVTPDSISLGTKGSYGIEELQFEFSADWDGMAKRVTFRPADGSDGVAVILDNTLTCTVPPEFTACAGAGQIAVDGLINGQRIISLTLIGNVAQTIPPASRDSIAPTPTQIDQLMGLYQECTEAAASAEEIAVDASAVADDAKDTADAASDTADEAKRIAQSASNKVDTLDTKITTEVMPELPTAQERAYWNAKQDAIPANTYDSYGAAAAVQSEVDTIEAKIPNAASAQNQLADKDFVNSSIATSTANFIGTFNSVADLEAYSGTLTTNDYAFVVSTDSAGNTVYDRYKYNGTEWLYEYTLNNSSFTAAQWAAINSGITASKLSDDETLLSTIDGAYIAQVSVNGTPVQPTSLQGGGKGVNVTVPTAVSGLTNDLSYTTQSEVTTMINNAIGAAIGGSY